MEKQTISVIKQMFQSGQVNDENITLLEKDSRKGVEALVKKYYEEKAKQALLLKNYQKMQAFENQARERGATLIAGVDEAGRGPLAGPLVVAAVILPDNFILLGLNDSKKLSIHDRNRFFDEIVEHAVSYQIEIISNEVIDKINILQATKLGMRTAVENLSVKPDHVLLDAVELQNLTCPSEAIVKGDERSVSIAAASILAKVTRDRMMQEIDQEFPMYGFKSHMGYGTKEHLGRLKQYGVTKFHRKSFAPVRSLLN